MERGLPADERRGVVRLLAAIGGGVAVLSVVFGVTIWRNHSTFREYQSLTLESDAAPPRWATEALSAEQCVQAAVQWGMDCPGIGSWCLAELPVVTRSCLESSDRMVYCEQVGDEVMSTRFGFHECEDMRADMDDDAEKYAKRANKKYCAASFRAVADYCLELRGLR